MVLDGAMGTAIQRDRPDEAGYRGERFADWPSDLIGNNDLLTLTQPEIIAGIHREYLEAGADIIETNTFNANAVSLADYGLQELAYELNLEAARLARREADACRAPRSGRGTSPARSAPPPAPPRSRPDVNDPAARNVSFDQLVAAYLEAARGLVDGGSDLLVIETIFDTLNAKAAIFAVETLFEEHGRRWPVIISGTITDASGRTLSGPGHRGVLGLRAPRPAARSSGSTARSAPRRCAPTSRSSPGSPTRSSPATRTPACPNAFGEYDEAPEETSAIIGEFAESGFVNLVGGCCGTTPAHIAAIAAAVDGKEPPRRSRRSAPAMRLSGLEPFTIDRGQPVRERRRAHEHHRLGQVPQPDQGRRLRHRAVGRRPAGRERRAGHRRQHGRGHDRRRRRDGPLPQADRERARHQPGPGDGRLLEVGGHRGRPEERPGQADRQLDLHEGGRGEVPRARPAVPQVRRRRRRDGLRRGRPGRQPRAPQGDLRAGLPDPGRRGRLPARGHHLRPQRLRRRDRHRGARVVRP